MEGIRTMDEYLNPTELCDSDNEEIKRKARDFVKTADTPKQAALAVFSYVRDSIIFGLDNCDTKASQTLRKGIGFCITKCNLQVALLRASGIPARYHRAVLPKSSLKGILPAFSYRAMPDKIWWHPWCECFLSETWISCDSLLDKRLYDAMCNQGLVTKEQIPTIDWDGESDLNTMKSWMLEDLGTSSSLDDVFRKAQNEVLPPKIITGFLFRVSNLFTNRLRKHGSNIE